MDLCRNSLAALHTVAGGNAPGTRSQRCGDASRRIAVRQRRRARFGIDQILLSDDSGRTLAFGPCWTPSSTPLRGRGLTVISARRDTHFSLLRDVLRADALVI